MEPFRLPGKIAEAISDGSNDVLFSAVSIWKIAIKTSLGRVEFSRDPDSVLKVASETGFTELPISAATALLVASLPWVHRDPFDRLLVAQAMAQPARLYTSDRVLAGYSELVQVYNPR